VGARTRFLGWFVAALVALAVVGAITGRVIGGTSTTPTPTAATGAAQPRTTTQPLYTLAQAAHAVAAGITSWPPNYPQTPYQAAESDLSFWYHFAHDRDPDPNAAVFAQRDITGAIPLVQGAAWGTYDQRP
jgi:hypothetical protein